MYLIYLSALSEKALKEAPTFLILKKVLIHVNLENDE